jgi:hypothetical protein
MFMNYMHTHPPTHKRTHTHSNERTHTHTHTHTHKRTILDTEAPAPLPPFTPKFSLKNERRWERGVTLMTSESA